MGDALTFVPCFYEQPFVGAATVEGCVVDDRLPFPPFSDDVGGVVRPGGPRFRRCVGDSRNQVFCGRGVLAWVAIPTEINRLSCFYQLVEPLESSQACLPDSEADVFR